MDRIDFPFTNFGFPFRHRKWNRLRQVAQVTQPARCPRPETENCREENELPIPNKSCKNCKKGQSSQVLLILVSRHLGLLSRNLRTMSYGNGMNFMGQNNGEIF